MTYEKYTQSNSHHGIPRYARNAAFALITAAFLVACDKPSEETAMKNISKPTLTVTIATPSMQPMPASLSANGTVTAWQEAIIGPEVNGLRVTELLVNVGDRVRKGQALAVFSRDSVANDLRLAEAALHEASAAAVEAKADGDRARNLRGSGSLSDQRVQQLLTQEQTAQARVESAQAQLASQQLKQSQTTLRAPDDGVISARSASVGAVPVQGTEMFRLIRQGRLEWRGEFTASELEYIQPGQKVQITSPAGKVLHGHVRLAAPTVDATSRRGIAYVDIDRSEDKGAQPIRPGAYVRGELTTGTQQTLVVPQSAVVARDGFHLVFVVGKELHVSQRKVQIGRLVGDRQEILSGIQQTDQLVSSGGAFLTDGDTVQLGTKSASALTRSAKPAQR